MSIIEIIAVVMGLAAVWMTITQNIWCWPTGIVQVTLYIIIFHEVKLYSDMVLQAIYVVLQIYGWWHWLHGGRDHGRLLVSVLPRRAFVAWLAATAAGTAALGWVMTAWTDAAAPYADGFVTVASLVAQWLMTRKHTESWIFWILVNIVAIAVYFYKELYLTSGLYVAFLMMAVMGLREWRKALPTGTGGEGEVTA